MNSISSLLFGAFILTFAFNSIETERYDSRRSLNSLNSEVIDFRSNLEDSLSTANIKNIKCVNKENVQRMTATIKLPEGFVTVPLFEDASHVNPTVSDKCSMKQSSINSVSTFSMKINDFKACGVKLQRNHDGREWLSATIRFPYVGGLRTSDDEYVVVMCRPEEPVVIMNRVLDFKGNQPVLPKKVFSSEMQSFDANVNVFVKPDDTGNFVKEVPFKGSIEVGEEVQLRFEVRKGDGWNFAKVQDITIHRIISTNEKQTKNSSKSQTPNIAYLVLGDGCRNPVYTSIAPTHPLADKKNPLVVTFNFHAFMFQEKSFEDSIRITAKIVACQQEKDCSPTLCMDNNERGFGRKKRSIDNSANTTLFYSNFDAKVVIPNIDKGKVFKSRVTEELESMYHFTFNFIIIMAAIFCIVFSILSCFVSHLCFSKKY